jgi:hypothetical protein
MDYERHVVPTDDLIVHDTRGDCVCGPRFWRAEDYPGWVYIHHSLDHREDCEWDHEDLPQGLT